MTIDETKKVLSFLYSCFPSAPRLARDDKDRMILSFFRVLYKYAQRDVINAIIDTCKKSKGFIPSVYDIAKNIVITPAVDYSDVYQTERERYLDDKYDYVDVYSLRTQKRLEYDLIGTGALVLAELDEYIHARDGIKQRRIAAEKAAEIEYYKQNELAAMPDFKRLGVEYETETKRLK